MNRERFAASAIHLRIGRLVVDADALGIEGIPHDLNASLQAALSSRLNGAPRSPAQAQAPHQWIDAIAANVAASVLSTSPERP